MVTGLLRALGRKQKEPPVEMLDVEALKSRIGGPPAPKQPAPPAPDYVRTDGRQQDVERSWRKVAGLTR